jgi:hypothetical protein
MGDAIRVNTQTGEIGVQRADGWHVYQPGMYKINQQTMQVGVPDAGMKNYEIHGITQSDMMRLQSPDAQYASQFGAVGTGVGTPNPGLLESTIRGAQQGVTLGTSDEISGAVKGLMYPGAQNPIDPDHPVTGGMATGFMPAYLSGAGQERAANQAAKENNPKAYKSAFLAGSMVPAMAAAPTSIAGTAGVSAVQGGVMGGGLADTNDVGQTAKNAAVGAAIGGVLGAGFRALFNAALANNSAPGLAYRTIAAANPDETMEQISARLVRAGMAPAEVDTIMSDVLKSAAARNPSAATQAIPVAQGQMQQANNAAVQSIDNMVSPENAVLLGQQIQADAQAASGPAYAAAHANPARVGLLPETTERPSFQQALQAAAASAADEWPPRQIDPTNLSAKDIDLIDRVLQATQRAATESRGDPGLAAQVARATIPTRGQVADNVRTVADQAFPDLATARANAAHAFSLQDALQAGGQALNQGREAVEVATEYGALNAAQQEAYRAGLATKLRTMLATKAANANVGAVFDKTGIADKLEAVGFPRNAIDQIIEGGAGARRVLDALQGGSDTARKLLAAKAGEAGISQVKPNDLIAGSVMGADPVTKGAISVGLPMIRAAGSRAERNAAGMVIQALTEPGGGALQALINRAPQSWGGTLTGLPATAGGASASMLAQALAPWIGNQNQQADPRLAELARQLLSVQQ